MIGEDFFGKRYPSKIGAAFEYATDAMEVSNALRHKLGIVEENIKLIAPNDPQFEVLMEPVSEQVKQPLLASYIFYGAIGLIVGAIVWIGLSSGDIAMMESSPVVASGLILGLCIVASLMIGGLLASRPNHDKLIKFARSKIQKRLWVVVVQVDSKRQKKLAQQMLDSAATEQIFNVQLLRQR